MVLYVSCHEVLSVGSICGFVYRVGGGAYLVFPGSNFSCYGFPWSKGMIELVGESGLGVERAYRSCP